MKIDVRQELLDYRGKPIIEGDNRTFRDFLSIALINITQDEILTGEQKAMAHQIEKKLYSANKIDLTKPERDYAKERAEKILPIVHAGRIIDILDEVEPLPILSTEELAGDTTESIKSKLGEMGALPQEPDLMDEPVKK